MPIIQVIMQAIRVGVPAAQIISKYGKKSYDIAKKFYKTKNKTDLVGDVVISGGSAGSAAIIAMMAKEKMQKEKKKKERTESRKKQRGMRSGGTVNSRTIAKKYFKGGIVSLNQLTRPIGYR